MKVDICFADIVFQAVVKIAPIDKNTDPLRHYNRVSSGGY
jgi:hypothetical protein